MSGGIKVGSRDDDILLQSIMLIGVISLDENCIAQIEQKKVMSALQYQFANVVQTFIRFSTF